MKKQVTLFLLFITAIGLSSCSKEGEAKTIDVATGTFVGNLTVMPKAGGIKILDNSTIVLTKEGEGKIKATPVASSGGSPIVFDVSTDDFWVENPEGDPKGFFLYNNQEESLSITITSGAVPSTWYFKGFKQK